MFKISLYFLNFSYLQGIFLGILYKSPPLHHDNYMNWEM